MAVVEERVYDRTLVDLVEYEREVWQALIVAVEANRPPLRVRQLAACRGEAPSVFFPERGGNASLARLICSGCPVQVACATWARGRGRRLAGIWGGTTELER